MSWLSHEIHVLEADGLRFVANNIITPNIAKIDTFFAAEAPQGAEALITLVESGDEKVLGPVASGIVNGTLNGYKTQIETELAALAPEVGSYAQRLVTAILAVADKLAAN